MPIDTTNNVPPAPKPVVDIVQDSSQVPALNGLVGKPNSLQSRTMFGMVDWNINGRDTRLISVNLELYNSGTGNWNVGPNRGPSAKFYSPGVNFSFGLSRELIDVFLRRPGNELPLPGLSMMTAPVLHWSAFYPAGGVPPSHLWHWNEFILEWETGAVPLGDALVAGNFIDLGDFGREQAEEVEIVVMLDKHDAFGFMQEVVYPMRIERGQAEVIW